MNAIDVLRATVSVIIAVLLLFCLAGGHARAQDTAPPAQPAAANTPEQAPPQQQSAADSLSSQTFKKVLPVIRKATALFDKQDSLPTKTYFFANQESNQEAINELLDEAVGILKISQVTDYRDQIRQLQKDVTEAQERIVKFKEERISAPKESQGKSFTDKINPFHNATREEYDRKIAGEEAVVKADNESIIGLKLEFAKGLRAIGIDISDEAVEALLSTVSGDDFVAMSVVFDNVKIVTIHLRELTETSAEAPQTAKQYYGMYVILAKVLDRTQKTCINRISDEYIPKLRKCEERAQAIIEEAQKLMASNGGDKETLTANINANELTKSAVDNYIAYLGSVAESIKIQNQDTERIVLTAANTYKTVDVSANAGTLIANGTRDLDKLMNLQMPPLRAFNNEALRKEYERLNHQIADVK